MTMMTIVVMTIGLIRDRFFVTRLSMPMPEMDDSLVTGDSGPVGEGLVIVMP